MPLVQRRGIFTFQAFRKSVSDVLISQLTYRLPFLTLIRCLLRLHLCDMQRAEPVPGEVLVRYELYTDGSAVELPSSGSSLAWAMVVVAHFSSGRADFKDLPQDSLDRTASRP